MWGCNKQLQWVTYNLSVTSFLLQLLNLKITYVICWSTIHWSVIHYIQIPELKLIARQINGWCFIRLCMLMSFAFIILHNSLSYAQFSFSVVLLIYIAHCLFYQSFLSGLYISALYFQSFSKAFICGFFHLYLLLENALSQQQQEKSLWCGCLITALDSNDAIIIWGKMKGKLCDYTLLRCKIICGSFELKWLLQFSFIAKVNTNILYINKITKLRLESYKLQLLQSTCLA